jgi:hypothetical protein
MHPVVFFLVFDVNLKLYHWMTESFARHTAADKLHEKVLALGDRFVEVFIGRYKRPALTKKELTHIIQSFNDKTIHQFLDFCERYLTNDIFQYISDKDVDLLNIRDELVSDISQARYLFTLK